MYRGKQDRAVPGNKKGIMAYFTRIMALCMMYHSWCTLFCLEYAGEDFSRAPDDVNVLLIISERGWECKAQMRKLSDDIRTVAE